jgi:hypothetical protein
VIPRNQFDLKNIRVVDIKFPAGLDRIILSVMKKFGKADEKGKNVEQHKLQ